MKKGERRSTRREPKKRAPVATLPPEGLRLSPGMIDALIRTSRASDATMPGEGEFIRYAARKEALLIASVLLRERAEQDKTMGGELLRQVSFLGILLAEMAADDNDRPILDDEPAWKLSRSRAHRRRR